MGIEYARNPQKAVYSKDCLYCQYQTNEKGYVTVQYRLGLRPSHLIASAIAFVMGIVLWCCLPAFGDVEWDGIFVAALFLALSLGDTLIRSKKDRAALEAHLAHICRIKKPPAMTKDEFREKWLEHFAADISKSELEAHVTSEGNLLWHLFTYELLDKKFFLEGKDAKRAYAKIPKDGSIFIEWFESEETEELTPQVHTVKALDQMVEVYVVARDFSWTYIKTHESNCGPFFMMKEVNL